MNIIHETTELLRLVQNVIGHHIEISVRLSSVGLVFVFDWDEMEGEKLVHKRINIIFDAMIYGQHADFLYDRNSAFMAIISRFNHAMNSGGGGEGS